MVGVTRTGRDRNGARTALGAPPTISSRSDVPSSGRERDPLWVASIHALRSPGSGGGSSRRRRGIGRTPIRACDEPNVLRGERRGRRARAIARDGERVARWLASVMRPSTSVRQQQSPARVRRRWDSWRVYDAAERLRGARGDREQAGNAADRVAMPDVKTCCAPGPTHTRTDSASTRRRQNHRIHAVIPLRSDPHAGTLANLSAARGKQPAIARGASSQPSRRRTRPPSRDRNATPARDLRFVRPINVAE